MCVFRSELLLPRWGCVRTVEFDSHQYWAVSQITLVFLQDHLCQAWRLVTCRDYPERKPVASSPSSDETWNFIVYLRRFWLDAHFEMFSSWKLNFEERLRVATRQLGPNNFHGSLRCRLPKCLSSGGRKWAASGEKYSLTGSLECMNHIGETWVLSWGGVNDLVSTNNFYKQMGS